MNIELHEIPVKEVVNGYTDNDENGVTGYDGRLDIRPAFQREFVYKEKERNDVIYTVLHNFPLNVMYWVKNDDGRFELLDGQQRTVSICQYVAGDFSVMIDGMPRKYENLTKTEQEQILNYPLMIYFCEGTDKEKLDWFKIINLGGERLTDQELRNAIYTGEWLTDAKKYFSKSQCPASQIAGDYLKGPSNRQADLETALKWISDRDGITIENYMSKHQHDSNCSELWDYFRSVINWVNTTFPHTRKKFMNGLDWGLYYNRYSKNTYNPVELEDRISKLLCDDDVTNQKGIYEYLLSGQEKFLNIRTFSVNMARTAYEKQQGICPMCGKHYSFEDMQADHIIPWSKGGKTEASNLQMLCKKCNLKKSNY